MVILGIDPGLERVGWGVLEKSGSRLTPLEFGLILTPRVELPTRLKQIHDELQAILSRHPVEFVVSERIHFAVNKTTALDVAKALGVVLHCIAEHRLPWCEFTPAEVKLAVVGVGNAEKRQVQFMVAKLLGLSEAPKPDDVADALAIAICGALHSKNKGL